VAGASDRGASARLNGAATAEPVVGAGGVSHPGASAERNVDVQDNVATPSRLDELTERARRIVAASDPTLLPPQVRGPQESADESLPDERVGEAWKQGSAEGHAPLPAGGLPLPPLSSGERGPGGKGALILGIDPGTATMGYGLVRALGDGSGAYQALAYGVFETPAGEAMHLRLRSLYERLTELLGTHRPGEAAVEKLFFGRNTTTALTVGQARGVALLAIAQAGLDVAEYTPAEVKFALSSYGRATKTDIQRMAQMLLRLPAIPQPDDAADALAIALCHAHSMRAHALGIR
jgi:crossover junction endodeoxyribonuclease RuvC